MSEPAPVDARARYAALVGRVDAFHTAASVRLAERLTCRKGCSGCCQREVSVFEIEAGPIRAFLAEHPPVVRHPSACPMLDDEGACQIYAVRPLICRTHGLPIRFAGPDRSEKRDVCPLNEAAGLDPWTAPAAAILTIDVLTTQLALLNRAAGFDERRSAVGEL